MTDIDEVTARYRRRADSFQALVAGVDPGAWARRSPCTAWTARDVVGHAVDMHRFVLDRLDPPSEGISVEADPHAAFVEARRAIEEVLENDQARHEVETPTGPMPLMREIDEVVSDDLPIHGWDLAKATDQDPAINSVDVERLWSQISAIPEEVMEKYRTPGAFGPGIEVYGLEVHVEPQAPLQDRLLGILGRDPRWRPAQ